MIVKVTVKTPKNQAKESMRTQKSALLGYRQKKYLVEEKLVDHNEFYWVLDLPEEKMNELTKNVARGEVLIKKFYRTVFKLLGRAQKIATKTKKGGAWVRRWVKNRVMKMQGKTEGMGDYFDKMSDDELMRIDDKEEIEELISNPMIIVEKL